MMDPRARLVPLSPASLAAVRRRTGDYSDTTITEACAIGLSYWATGRGPEGMDLGPATLFPDVLGRVHNGGAGSAGWTVGEDGRSITVPEGVEPADVRGALDDLVDFPDRPLGTITAAGASARAELLARWNDTDAERDRPTLVAMFREQVRTRPDAVAVVDEHRSLTYRQADELSCQLAHHLIGRGLGPEEVVGISLGRSADMVIGLLAVLRAGGAFVPLDPQWPAARRSVVIEDARAVLQLNDSGYGPRVNRKPSPSTSATGATTPSPPTGPSPPCPGRPSPT